MEEKRERRGVMTKFHTRLCYWIVGGLLRVRWRIKGQDLHGCYDDCRACDWLWHRPGKHLLFFSFSFFALPGHYVDNMI